MIEVNKAKGVWEQAVAACEVAKYKAFRTTFQAAQAKRVEDLATIKKLMSTRAAAAKKPGSGGAGARCERPRSNGDNRKRRLCTPDAGLCCGAASQTVDGALMTIETCQKKEATTWDYQPPRGPMELTMPAKKSWTFACIGGAQRVLAAAAAAAGLAIAMQ